jgi:hypothetical protein
VSEERTNREQRAESREQRALSREQISKKRRLNVVDIWLPR